MKNQVNSLPIKAIFKIAMTLMLFVSAQLSFGQDIAGRWMTIDDETGKLKSVVEVYKKSNGKYYGKILKLFRSADQDQNPKCTDCDTKDARYNKPLLGMEILKDLTKKGDEYVNGTILDPKKGTVYKCKFWKEDGVLKVRGYVAMFYRTQTWKPVPVKKK